MQGCHIWPFWNTGWQFLCWKTQAYPQAMVSAVPAPSEDFSELWLNIVIEGTTTDKNVVFTITVEVGKRRKTRKEKA